MKRIVLTNDDGPHSPGLKAMAECLAGLGELMVIAPSKWLSGCGKSITLRKTISVRELDASTMPAHRFYVVDGTPADAFLIALRLLDREPDLLVSGINLGPNLGVEDLLHSGTLGATLQAALHGVPALAISYGPYRPSERPTGPELERDLAIAAEVGARLAKAILEHGMPEGVDIISVNVPVRPDPRRIVITRLLEEPFWMAVRDRDGFFMAPWALPDSPPAGRETDAGALAEGYISITPIRLEVKCELGALGSLLARAGLEVVS